MVGVVWVSLQRGRKGRREERERRERERENPGEKVVVIHSKKTRIAQNHA